MKRRGLTEEEKRIARDLHRGGMMPKQIAAILGRPRSTVAELFIHRRKPKYVPKNPDPIAEKIVVPEFVLDERNERLSRPHRDLTAMLMGDPRPGYSAAARRA